MDLIFQKNPFFHWMVNQSGFHRSFAARVYSATAYFISFNNLFEKQPVAASARNFI